MKRNLILLLTVLMLVVAPAMLLRAEAATIVDSGICGGGLTWTLDDAGTLTISGTGAMTDYSFVSDTPWVSHRESILSIVVEEGVTHIGAGAFSGCSALESMTIPSAGGMVKTFGEYDLLPFGYIFGKRSYAGGTATMQHYYSNHTSSYVGENFYIPSSLKSVTVTGGEIGLNAFENCGNLTAVTLLENITSIGYSAFRGCASLSSITIPDSVTIIDGYAFSGCTSLSSITIPDSVTSIDNYAFSGCTSLSSITIPDSVTIIEYGVFSGCTSLSNITIPDSVTIIEYAAFSDCWDLDTVHYAGTEEQQAEIQVGVDNKWLTYATWHYECNGVDCKTPPPTDPDVTEPATTDPEVTEPKPTDPEVTEPKPTEPKPTEPKPTEPKPTEPKPTEPKPTEPKPTEPKPAEPKPTEPEESQPGATQPGEDTSTENPFTDVRREDYYYDPVRWAVANGITNGLDATHFGPEAGCTRAHVVTFLWRAAGSPGHSSHFNPFVDVTSDSYYYNAVLWAVEKGITNGTSATTFDPDATCTRGQIVTFLWRYKDSPDAVFDNSFSDVLADQYYSTAVAWAVEKGITNGMGEGIFAPDATCTRGQIVTFLYRAM